MYCLSIKHYKQFSLRTVLILGFIFLVFLWKSLDISIEFGKPLIKGDLYTSVVQKKSLRSNNERTVKLILLYTKFFGDFWNDHPSLGPLRPPILPGREAFDDCDYKCEITYEHDLLPLADAVGFHGPDIHLLSSNSLPNRTRPDQIWFYYILENPTNCNISSSLNRIFNWTMSYRQNSEIYIPYGKYSSLEPGDIVKEVDLTYKDLFVAWMASNCRETERNTYVGELQKFIPVDVYGHCGRFTCPLPRRSSSCRLLLKRYKFYLAFENGNCHDYITEKYWDNALENDIVPVVMGGADYSSPALAIPNSYMDVRDFDSPKDLAEYLIYLSQNDSAYMEYFQWKKKYKLVAPMRACPMCTALYNQELYDPPRTIVDLGKAWSKSDCWSLNLLNKSETQTKGISRTSESPIFIEPLDPTDTANRR
ncbi:galactoside 3(4)-L-fucosyltransferase-like [Actinia tenebrosa]|uniref:Fucosyltransferase n=1 Tax=Actinia tenebrosa TaxID=6105 RepID=A0A6P8J4Y3_ACTTE|nr:galactoside 3(4)-L-fucosyltransferase-like [Actinia tenebrosa]